LWATGSGFIIISSRLLAAFSGKWLIREINIPPGFSDLARVTAKEAHASKLDRHTMMRESHPLSNGHQASFGNHLLDCEVHMRYARLSLGDALTKAVTSRCLPFQGGVINKIGSQHCIKRGEKVLIEHLEGIA
jgi:hypothetical protein